MKFEWWCSPVFLSHAPMEGGNRNLPSMSWSDSKWCYFFFEYTERYTITRLRTKVEADASFMSSSYHLHIAFICLVPNTGTRLVISVHGINICDGSWKAGHPSHPIPSNGSNPPYPPHLQSPQPRPGALSHALVRCD